MIAWLIVDGVKSCQDMGHARHEIRRPCQRLERPEQVGQVLRPEQTVVIAAEQRTDWWIGLIKTVLDGVKERIRRRLGQQPEFSGK